MLAHLIPHLTNSLNYSLRDASIAFTYDRFALIGIFLGGYLGDKYNKQKLVVAMHVGTFSWAAGYRLCEQFLLGGRLRYSPWNSVGNQRPSHGGLESRLFRLKVLRTIMGFSSSS